MDARQMAEIRERYTRDVRHPNAVAIRDDVLDLLAEVERLNEALDDEEVKSVVAEAVGDRLQAFAVAVVTEAERLGWDGSVVYPEDILDLAAKHGVTRDSR